MNTAPGLDDPLLEIPSVEDQKNALRNAVIDAPYKYRIVFVGNFFQGPTGIVSSIHRALENLGHTVFKIDPRRHKDVLDKSSGAKGGYGPIWFKPREIDQVFRTFQPDMLVLCAGGMVINEEDARYLKDRGVISVGLTLSDPDVQESMIEHVSHLDLHATNAQLAYDRYMDEGHTNTFLFPFGIDRSYVLRDVTDDPALQADAIAIGHAQGRPDRHEIMVPLADRLKVRTYGSGWPIPGSEPVSGDKLLQAAKGGTVHVNFPATRAGFTNVKCGVFETIGTGSILATTRFDEMARLFEFGTEILGYENADDLGDSIAALKDDPIRLETMRRRSFRRLLEDHLYERRWNTFFAEALARVDSEEGPWSDDSRVRLATALRSSRQRPRNILISGYYGARNRGDDILLDALRARITQEVPDANVIAAAVNAKEVENAQGIQAFRRADPYESDSFASSATSLILGPGGLWHDYTVQKAGGVAGIVTGATISPSHLVQLPLMVRAHGGTFHVHGMGVGPLVDTAAKAGIHLTGLLAETVTVRDEESKALLQDCTSGWASEPVVSPDVAYTLPLADVPSAPSELLPQMDYIAVNVRPFQENAESLETIRDVVFEVARARNLSVLGVPMQPVDSTALAEWTDHAGDVDFSILPQDAPYDVFLRSLQDATAIVSMRLHTNLFAHRLGKAPIGIAYDPKLSGHFTQLGRADFAIPMPVDANTLRQRLDEVDPSAQLADEVKQRVHALEEAADATLSDLCRRMADAPKILPDSGSMIEAPPKEKTKAADSTRWPLIEDVNLRNASVIGGNDEDPERSVDVVRRANPKGDLFHIDLRAPQRGDFAAWEIEVPVPEGGDGIRIELWLIQRYREKKRFSGRMAYEVSVDDTVLFHEDVTGWSERNSIWIAKRTTAKSVHLRIRLYALRNTENWGWGKATTTIVEGLRAQPWDASSDLLWGASSPAAVPLIPREVQSGQQKTAASAGKRGLTEVAPESSAGGAPGAASANGSAASESALPPGHHAEETAGSPQKVVEEAADSEPAPSPAPSDKAAPSKDGVSRPWWKLW